MDYGKPPAQWSIERSERDERLRLGNRSLRLSDITGFQVAAISEENIGGHLAIAALFFAVSTVLTLPVALGTANPRFLVGSVLFAGIGLMVVQDLLRGHRLVVHRVVISLADGTSATFTSPDPEACSNLAEALRRRLGRHVGQVR